MVAFNPDTVTRFSLKVLTTLLLPLEMNALMMRSSTWKLFALKYVSHVPATDNSSMQGKRERQGTLQVASWGSPELITAGDPSQNQPRIALLWMQWQGHGFAGGMLYLGWPGPS